MLECLHRLEVNISKDIILGKYSRETNQILGAKNEV